MLKTIWSWLQACKSKPMNGKLAVRFDEQGVRIIVLDRLEPDWNQSFAWADVKRVCFMDRGIYSSDVILVHLHGRDRPAAVLTEADGGGAFLGALAERGLFPEELWRRALGETGGAMHCWPPQDGREA